MLSSVYTIFKNKIKVFHLSTDKRNRGGRNMQNKKSNKKIMVSQRYNTHYFSSFKDLFKAFYSGQLDRSLPFDCFIEAYRHDNSHDVDIVLYKECLQAYSELKAFYKHLNY